MMNSSNRNPIIVGFLLLTAAVYAWAQAPSTAPSSTRTKNVQAWEHLAFEHEGHSIHGDPKLARKINQLGDDGWELVDVETQVRSGATFGKIFFFKRPK